MANTRQSALLDTSFLITMVDASRDNHRVAQDYYRLMIEAGIPMYLSAIAVAEFAVNQPITDLPLNNFRLLPFNLPHANTAAELWHLLGQKRPTGTPRHVARDDIKLIAQATHEGIQFIFTEDKATLYRYCERLNKISQQVVRSVVLANGYDSAVFSNNPQKGLDFESS